MDGEAVRQLIIDELDFEPSIEAVAHLGCRRKRHRYLTGHVGDYAEKIAVEDAVNRVRGVKAIAQEHDARYPFSKKSSDDEIAKRALAISIGTSACLTSDWRQGPAGLGRAFRRGGLAVPEGSSRARRAKAEWGRRRHQYNRPEAADSSRPT